MKKLSDTMKYIEERRDFVRNEELKRRYPQEGLEPAGETDYQPIHFLSRKDFVEDKGLMEKYSKEESGNSTRKISFLKPLEMDERCLRFSEYVMK